MDPDCNIGRKGIRRRAWLGAVLIIAGVISSFLDRSFLGQVVVFFGFLSLFQALDGTCVAMASRGARETNEGREILTDPNLVARFQRRARRIYLKTTGATLVVMFAGRAWLYFKP